MDSSLSGVRAIPSRAIPPDIANLVRVSATVAVVGHHVAQFTYRHSFATFGKWGVATFFLLSGYLLSKPYLRALANDRPWPSMRDFLGRRCARMLPVYELAVLASVVINVALSRAAVVKPPLVAQQIGRTPFDLPGIASHALMLHDFSFGTAVAVNGPLWTMPVNFEFYLALPVFALIARLAISRFANVDRRAIVGAMLAGAIVASIGYRFWIAGPVMARLADRQFSAIYVLMDNGLGLGCAFVLGIGLAFATMDRPKPVTPALGGACVLAAVLSLGLLWRAADDASRVEWAVQTMLAAVASALLLVGLSSMPAVATVAASRFVSLGASLGFAIYAIHYPVLEVLSVVIPLERGAGAFVILGACEFAVVVPLAYAAHRFVEIPLARAVRPAPVGQPAIAPVNA
ncbi:MAG: hypothetical protein NVS2B3_06950 [Vulcanimicrobiaceae bacterium]